MIAPVRHGAIALLTLVLPASLAIGGNAAAIALAAGVPLFWLLAGRRLPMMQLFALPLCSFLLLLGFLYGNGAGIQYLILVLLSAVWDLDDLYRESVTRNRIHNAVRLLTMAALRALGAGGILASAFGISSLIDLNPGFWPLLAGVLLLALLFKRIFARAG